MWYRLVCILLALGAIGCQGTARVKLENESDRFVHGSIGGKSYSVECYGTRTINVKVGGTWSSSSDVKIVYNVHETCSEYSSVTGTASDTREFEKGHSYTISLLPLIHYNSSAIKIEDEGSTSSIFAP